MQQQEEEETRSGFLMKNLVRGLIGFVVIITVFILMEGYIQDNFQSHIGEIRANPGILYGIYTLSEIVFGILPPELFMMIWILDHIDVSGFIVNLSILTVISYGAGVLGYYIGNKFSKTAFYQNRIRDKYLKQYEKNLKKFGGYLVFVGAVTRLFSVCRRSNPGSVFGNMYVSRFGKHELQKLFVDLHYPRNPVCRLRVDGVDLPQPV